MTPREQAIEDCKYAMSLGYTSYKQHIDIWGEADIDNWPPEELEYLQTLQEIDRKLGGDQCLLREKNDANANKSHESQAGK